MKTEIDKLANRWYARHDIESAHELIDMLLAQAALDEHRRLYPDTSYETQTFEEAHILMKNLVSERLYLLLRNCGVLRNDAEVKAFDKWEQSQ